MKHIAISLDDLDSSLPRLWETCMSKGMTITMNPSENKMVLFLEGEKIAEILVVNITSPYDIADSITIKD